MFSLPAVDQFGVKVNIMKRHFELIYGLADLNQFINICGNDNIHIICELRSFKCDRLSGNCESRIGTKVVFLVWIHDDTFYKSNQESDAESDDNESDFIVFHIVKFLNFIIPCIPEKGGDIPVVTVPAGRKNAQRKTCGISEYMIGAPDPGRYGVYLRRYLYAK